MIIETTLDPVEVDENNEPVLNMVATEADDDWLHAARLHKAAKQGDQEAAKELERMQNTPMTRRREV